MPSSHPYRALPKPRYVIFRVLAKDLGDHLMRFFAGVPAQNDISARVALHFARRLHLHTTLPLIGGIWHAELFRLSASQWLPVKPDIWFRAFSLQLGVIPDLNPQPHFPVVQPRNLIAEGCNAKLAAPSLQLPIPICLSPPSGLD